MHRLGAAAGAVQLPAAGALPDLRPLVLGDHPLELAQQLVLGRRAPLGLLREAHLHAGAQRALRAAAPGRRSGARGDPARGRAAPRTRPPPRGRAAAQAPAAISVAPEKPSSSNTRSSGTQQPALARRAHAARRSGSGSSRPGAGAPRTPARRSPPPCPSAVAARSRRSSSSSFRCSSRGAARAPRTRTPAPAARRRAGRTRTRSQRALPPCRSCA